MKFPCLEALSAGNSGSPPCSASPFSWDSSASMSSCTASSASPAPSSSSAASSATSPSSCIPSSSPISSPTASSSSSASSTPSSTSSASASAASSSRAASTKSWAARVVGLVEPTCFFTGVMEVLEAISSFFVPNAPDFLPSPPGKRTEPMMPDGCTVCCCSLPPLPPLPLIPYLPLPFVPSLPFPLPFPFLPLLATNSLHDGAVTNSFETTCTLYDPAPAPSMIRNWSGLLRMNRL
mmetsp:Transcript_16410/g.44502  ORF Transcript_16410/g.44502 Transcript_16410/m.44502 type:complete len:237 (-) Transcript_16410:602-1312(-)